MGFVLRNIFQGLHRNISKYNANNSCKLALNLCSVGNSRLYSTESSTGEPITVKLTKQRTRNGVRDVILNNSAKRNALSLEMLKTLQKDILDVTDDVRVIVLSAQGQVFSSGHDLKELTSENGEATQLEIFRECKKLMMGIQNLQVPVIAKVQGLCAAAGLQLVAACDIVVAGDRAKFSTPGVNHGLFCSTPAVELSRMVGRKEAMKMLLTGEPISAEQAFNHGLVTVVVDRELVDATAERIVNSILEKSKGVLQLGKKYFNLQEGCDRETAYKIATEGMMENLIIKDCQEGLEAFIEKRRPKWSHTYAAV